MLTVDEKRKKIEEYCDSNTDEKGFKKCDICPLYELPGSACYEPEVSDKDIEKHYDILFGKNKTKTIRFTPISRDTVFTRLGENNTVYVYNSRRDMMFGLIDQSIGYVKELVSKDTNYFYVKEEVE